MVDFGCMIDQCQLLYSYLYSRAGLIYGCANAVIPLFASRSAGRVLSTTNGAYNCQTMPPSGLHAVILFILEYGMDTTGYNPAVHHRLLVVRTCIWPFCSPWFGNVRPSIYGVYTAVLLMSVPRTGLSG